MRCEAGQGSIDHGLDIALHRRFDAQTRDPHEMGGGQFFRSVRVPNEIEQSASSIPIAPISEVKIEKVVAEARIAPYAQRSFVSLSGF